jgi:hypothetical protein
MELIVDLLQFGGKRLGPRNAKVFQGSKGLPVQLEEFLSKKRGILKPQFVVRSNTVQSLA